MSRKTFLDIPDCFDDILLQFTLYKGRSSYHSSNSSYDNSPSSSIMIFFSTNCSPSSLWKTHGHKQSPNMHIMLKATTQILLWCSIWIYYDYLFSESSRYSPSTNSPSYSTFSFSSYNFPCPEYFPLLHEPSYLILPLLW